MIEDIGGIETNREAPALADLNAFLDGHVRRPRAETLQSVLSKCTARAGLRSLQHNLTGGIIPQRIQRAKRRRQRQGRRY